MKIDYYTGTMVVNAIALLLFVLMFLNEKLRRKKKGLSYTKADSIFSLILLLGIVLSVALGCATLVGRENLLEHEKPFLFFRSVVYLSFQVCCALLPVFLICHNDEEEKFNKYRYIYAIPILVNTLLLVINFFTGILFYVEREHERLEFGPLSRVMMWLIFFYVIATLILLFRVNRIFVIIPLLLIVAEYYFSYTFYYVSTVSLVLALVVLYIALIVNSHTLLTQLCLILVPLLVAMTVFIANFVTVSSFLSYLKTIHDRNEGHMNDVIHEMEGYEALPWLIDYWVKNPDKIHEVKANEREPLTQALGTASLRGPSEELIREQTPEIQELFANACYTSMAEKYEFEYEEHNLDELDLIYRASENSAFVILSGVRAEDGSYRIGDAFDIESEMQDWKNYLSVTMWGPFQWLWGIFDEKDDFGFHIVLDIPGNEHTVELCNSFKRSEVYAHMEYISSFRVISLLVLAGLGVVVVYTIFYAVVVPLGRIRKSLSQYSEDKDSKKVSESLSKVRSQNETEDFAKEFSLLAKEMDRYTQQVANLAAEKERSVTELRMASDIQTSALPSPEDAFPDREEFDLYAEMNPAKTVGGDFYDFFMTDDNHLVILIADVSDKGIPAALFMMSAKNLINYRAREGGTPAEILTSANAQLCRNNKGKMFVTVWLGILEVDSGRLVFSNAGHEPMALSHDGEAFELVKGDKRPAIGILSKIKYTDQEMVLLPGDSLFLYTDGITEADRGEEDFFGRQRMLEALDGAMGKRPADIIKSVQDSISSFVGDAEQFDDMTMLCLTYKKRSDMQNAPGVEAARG